MFYKDLKDKIIETKELRNKLEDLKNQVKATQKELDETGFKDLSNQLKENWHDLIKLEDELVANEFTKVKDTTISHGDLQLTVIETKKVNYAQLLNDLVLDGKLKLEDKKLAEEKNTAIIKSLRMTVKGEK